MTQNQIKYTELKETVRHNLVTEGQQADALAETMRSNLARESETHRHNVESEQQVWHQIGETARHNQATEQISRDSLAETMRHNSETEAVAWSTLAENTRANKAREAETHAYNQAYLAEMYRSNVAKETETNRHNVQGEIETARHQQTQDFINAMSADVTLGGAGIAAGLAAAGAFPLLGERLSTNVDKAVDGLSQIVARFDNDINNDPMIKQWASDFNNRERYEDPWDDALNTAHWMSYGHGIETRTNPGINVSSGIPALTIN